MQNMRSPKRINRKKQQQAGLADEQETECLLLWTSSPLQDAYGASDHEPAESDHRAHRRLRVALSDIVGEKREISGHRRCEYAAQIGKTDEVNRPGREGRQQKNCLDVSHLEFARHDSSAGHPT